MGGGRIQRLPRKSGQLVRQNWPCSLKNVVLKEECREGHEGGANGEFGLQDPKTTKMPTKQGQTQQDHHCPHHMDWPQIGQEIAIEQGKGGQIMVVRISGFSSLFLAIAVFSAHSAREC